MLSSLSASTQLATSLEEFISDADVFLKKHYNDQLTRDEVVKMVEKIKYLRYEITEEGLLDEFPDTREIA